MIQMDAIQTDSGMLDELAGYLKIDQDSHDPSLAAVLVAAIGHAEAFTGQILIRRPARQILSAGSGWQRLGATPVAAIQAATGIPAEGASFVMEARAWQQQIDRHGDGFVRVLRPGIAGRVEIAFTAGIASEWGALPEALRLAVLRLAGHLYNNRDGTDDAGPPAAVAALLRPWRRMRLS